MNKTTRDNFFEIMEIAQKYHNAAMIGQDIDETTTGADALRVIQLCAEIRRDIGDGWAVDKSLNARQEELGICGFPSGAGKHHLGDTHT